MKDTSEIWSFELAYVFNLAKYDRDVDFLVAVDCFSGNLRVVSIKTELATEAIDDYQI